MKNEAGPVRPEITHHLHGIASLRSHPQADELIGIITGQTAVSSGGFPYISDTSFKAFIERIPHLFTEGEALLGWLQTLKAELDRMDAVTTSERESILRAVQVLRTVVFTAGVTAPSDLWLLKQVLSTLKQMGILDALNTAEGFDPGERKYLRSTLNFVYSRGYLVKDGRRFSASKQPQIARVLNSTEVLREEHRINFVPEFTAWLQQPDARARREEFLRSWLDFSGVEHPTGSWIASHFQIEVGYRLLPLVLSLRVGGFTRKLVEGATLAEQIPGILPEMIRILEHAGLARDGAVTGLGARVFERGPGPFGIIGAYHAYMNNLVSILNEDTAKAGVQRAANVAASQDANRKTFEEANDMLDKFCAETGFEYTVFVEHAVGRGEATRQRVERSGKDRIRFFGADLEDAAIDQAIEQQQRGFLPPNMEFIRNADIGRPEKVIDYLRERGLSGEPAVMMVGNGFHEIREQTNERMIEVFKAYQEAGFVLIFTEESGLDDEDLLQTAWNTYHAGFRYVHELSGQGLRPAVDRDPESRRYSWRRCASLGGYTVLDEFSYRSRKIYPYRRPERENPSISETYFCIPRKLAVQYADIVNRNAANRG